MRNRSRGAGVKTSTGVLLEKTDMAKFVDRQAERRGIPVQCFAATHPSGERAYVLVEGGAVVYEHTSIEAIGCHVEMMWMASDLRSKRKTRGRRKAV
jgi:hypothetical protein